jgi:hypothetical protein
MHGSALQLCTWHLAERHLMDDVAHPCVNISVDFLGAHSYIHSLLCTPRTLQLSMTLQPHETLCPHLKFRTALPSVSLPMLATIAPPFLERTSTSHQKRLCDRM